MAKRSAKKRAAKRPAKTRTKRMARKRREIHLPLWAVVCTLAVLAVGLAMWTWAPAPPADNFVPYANPGFSEPTWQAGPGDLVAFADSLAYRSKRVLKGLGIPPKVIVLERLPEHRGSQMRWEVKSEVPAGLPLAVCNLALTRLADRLGGEVLEGRQNLEGTLLSLRVGLDGKGTDLVSLRRNPNLARQAGRIALILDDFGYQDPDLISGFCALPQRVTLSIFPDEEHSVWTAQQAAAMGHGVMVHLPMEPIDYPRRDPGPDAIFVDYSKERIQALTRKALVALPHVRGVNNHMGSRVTENREAIQAVLEEVVRQKLFFVDSVTSSHSVAYDRARKLNIPCGRNALFLDRIEDTESVVQRSTTG